MRSFNQLSPLLRTFLAAGIFYLLTFVSIPCISLNFEINGHNYIISLGLAGTNKIDNASKNMGFNNTTEEFKRRNAGRQAGGSFEFPFKQKSVAIDLRYN